MGSTDVMTGLIVGGSTLAGAHNNPVVFDCRLGVQHIVNKHHSRELCQNSKHVDPLEPRASATLPPPAHSLPASDEQIHHTTHLVHHARVSTNTHDTRLHKLTSDHPSLLLSYRADHNMDDSNARTRKLVTTLINTVNQSPGADVDGVLRALKDYEVSFPCSRLLSCMLTTSGRSDPPGTLSRLLGTCSLFLQSRVRDNVVRMPERGSKLRTVLRLRALRHPMGFTCTAVS